MPLAWRRIPSPAHAAAKPTPADDGGWARLGCRRRGHARLEELCAGMVEDLGGRQDIRLLSLLRPRRLRSFWLCRLGLYRRPAVGWRAFLRRPGRRQEL